MTAPQDPGALAPPGRDLAAEAGPVRRSVAGRLPLYFHTVRHLRAGQIASQLRRRLVPPRPPAAPPAVELRPAARHAAFLPGPEPAPVPGQISFVGQGRPFAVRHPDWVARDAPKLWRYNLHYFDYLAWPGLDAAAKAALIDDWIARVPVGAEDAWEPYPVSLRVVNWLKYFLSLPPGGVPRTWQDSLAHQVAALEGDVEYHLLANHLLKNGKALVFAGACLSGPAATRWLALGLDILGSEAEAQVLPDGGHVERSPMYHCIVLEDYLDVVNLLARNPGFVPAEKVALLAAAARRATDFLRGIRTGAGDIPLFNDAAFGITRSAGDLLAYADTVFVGA
ncbi:MAG: heparinase II/III family protein, partial [Gammaproteobacteria bacterium]